MFRPKHLRKSVQFYFFEHLFSLMSAIKAPMIPGVPVLRQHNQSEAPLHFIDDRDNLIATRDSQGSARQEIVLNVNNNQGLLSVGSELGFIFKIKLFPQKRHYFRR